LFEIIIDVADIALSCKTSLGYKTASGVPCSICLLRYAGRDRNPSASVQSLAKTPDFMMQYGVGFTFFASKMLRFRHTSRQDQHGFAGQIDAF
jgi:hypothetical protein